MASIDAVSPNHPRHQLAFYVDQDVDFEIRESRTWSLGAPGFFDIHRVPEDQTRGDCCTDDVGGFIEIYSGWPPWTVPREVDMQQYEEVRALLSTLEEFSRDRGLSLEIHFAGEAIGHIADGSMHGIPRNAAWRMGTIAGALVLVHQADRSQSGCRAVVFFS